MPDLDVIAKNVNTELKNNFHRSLMRQFLPQISLKDATWSINKHPNDDVFIFEVRYQDKMTYRREKFTAINAHYLSGFTELLHQVQMPFQSVNGIPEEEIISNIVSGFIRIENEYFFECINLIPSNDCTHINDLTNFLATRCYAMAGFVPSFKLLADIETQTKINQLYPAIEVAVNNSLSSGTVLAVNSEDSQNGGIYLKDTPNCIRSDNPTQMTVGFMIYEQIALVINYNNFVKFQIYGTKKSKIKRKFYWISKILNN